MTNILTYFRQSPKFEVWHSHPLLQSKVLITAGVDGDEYQAIDLARQIISNYNLSTPITVIPIVNIAGYQAKTSYNPLDGRYLKYIYPGSRFGSSSSRLMHQVSLLTRDKSLWLDLHCAATGETLFPFAWASTEHPTLSHLDIPILLESSVDKKMPYIMLEGGNFTQVQTIIKNLESPVISDWKPTYTTISSEKNVGQKIPANTLWYTHNLIFTAS